MSEEVLEVIAEQEIFGKTFHVYGNWLEPLFLAKEVAELIDYAYKDSRKTVRDVSKMLSTVGEDEKGKFNSKLGGKIVPTQRGGLNLGTERWFLTEHGLYEVLFQSRKPLAKQFKKYVKAILKEIRLKGFYSKEPNTSTRHDLIIELSETIVYLKQQLEEAYKKIKEFENRTTTTTIDTSMILNRFSCRDGVIIANENVDASVFAWLIGEPNYKFTNSKIYEWMRNHNYLMSKDTYGSKNHNLPYDEYFTDGLFQVNDYKVIRGHAIHDATKLLITPKGQQYFGKLIRDEFIHTNKPILLESK